MFEPVHGSAPDIAGQGLANPLAAIWSVAQMMDHFGEEEWGRKIVSTIKQIIDEGEVLTPDFGGDASTEEVGDQFIKLLTSY
ncbi:hypothetical protein GCM10008986_08450 [Salinibacillus aidingensis]|uniref:Isopropylmalate dehydrogenase-like domain-containing protein n=1 Tax=Salinibacillus aidingensis TaxID=237684 RepID=A0ABN1AWS7_9BACI